MNIIIIILLILATRGGFALFDDLKKVIWIDRPVKGWNSFEGYKSERDEINETLDRR